MRIPGSTVDFEQLPAPLPVLRGSASAQEWLGVPMTLAKEGARLVSVWGSARGGGFAVCAAYATSYGLLWLDLPLVAGASYPDLTPLFPFANRMQRAIADLLGLNAVHAADRRSWLNHGAWSPAQYPLRGDSVAATSTDRQPGDYAFVRVEGEGVHEIPVGPVHAGIIEPGHFRFSVVGEKVLRLEERLGYTHKGIEQRFTQLPPLQAHRLAARVSGDSTVAFTWAYCMALESATGTQVSARSAWLRALMLEWERVANHLGDLGALGNDAALSYGLAQFSRLKEDWLRTAGAIFGHRLLMDCIGPGGVARDLERADAERILRQCDLLEPAILKLRKVYDEHAGLQDRFITTGRVQPALAAKLGLTGLAGRASAQAIDLRCDHPWLPYDKLDVKMATHRNGDVAARVTVRFEEALESLRLIRILCVGLPGGAISTELAAPDKPAWGAGWIEGWRGEVFVALELDAGPGGGRIVRCHCHDPSWQNWPVLEHAVIGNIVPDFPLINKSFNLSYAGHDL